MTLTQKKVKEEWEESEHPIWGRGGIADQSRHLFGLTRTFPEKIWQKGKFSIIPPCGITHNLWELYGGNDIQRFNTLKEAQAAAIL